MACVQRKSQTGNQLRGERRVCPTCTFGWLDRYRKNECPKCLNPVVPAFKSLKAKREFEQSVAQLRSSTSRLPRPPTPSLAFIHQKVSASPCRVLDDIRDKHAEQKEFTRVAGVDSFDVEFGGEKRGKSLSESQVAMNVKVHTASSTALTAEKSRRVRFADTVTAYESIDTPETEVPASQTPLKSAIKKASYTLDDFEMFKELLNQAPMGASQRCEQIVKEVAHPELRMTCPTCDYTWLDIHRKNECPKCWHALCRLPTDTKACRAFV